MTYAGARGKTAEQMSHVLQFSLPQDRLHPAFNELDLQLNNEQKNGPGEGDSRAFQLDIANQLWGQKDLSFLSEYLDLLQLNYGAGMRLMDFVKNPEPSRLQINDWVSQKTHEKIKDLIPPGGIITDTRLVLTNAIYFKADWTFPFEKNNTQDAPFTLLDGAQVNVPIMSFNDPKTLSYVEGQGIKAVELPYVGDTVSMWILVPDQGTFAEFEASLSEKKLGDLIAHSQPASLQVVLPKFEFTKEFQLSKVLTAMGVPDAFCGRNADFSGMGGVDDLLCIGEVYHKAFVAVDEKGTEAAAASAVVVMTESLPIQPQILTVDRPFIFLIRHKTSCSILFMGRVLDPRPDSGS
jgi:serpin B